MKTAKGFSPKTKIISLVLSFLIIFYLVPTSVFAEGLNSDTTVLDAPVPVDEERNTYPSEIYELIELREENVKHFRLEDGSYVAAQYNYPVHYTDESGQLIDIDNRLIESDSEFSTDNSRIKFVKKIAGNGNIFTIHENNTKITMGIVGAEKKTEGIVTSTNNSDDSIKTVLGKLTNLEKISSTILYKDILDGVDLEYIVHSLNIKENIIINERKNSYNYIFNIELNNLSAALSDDGNVYINSYDGETQYVIPAPVVFDANGVCAPESASSYTLSMDNNGKYELAVTVDSDWINAAERAFPVTLDPSILGSSINSVDLNIDSASPNSNTYYDESFYVSSTERAYLKFNVSQFADIPAGAAIMKAELAIIGSCSTNSNTRVGAYDITTNWDNTLTWNKTTATPAQGSFDNAIIDYTVIESATRYSWNITELYKRWINGGTNYGVGLRLVDETANTERAGFTSWDYTPPDDDINYYGPVMMITYIYNDGLEGYYPTTSHSAGSGGAGSINLSTGRLTLAIPTLTTTDSLFAFTPTLVYNSSLAGKANTKENISSPFSTSYMPYGVKLNIQETIIEKPYTDADGSNRKCYLLYDADGSTHDFYSKWFVSPYYDDDGLRLELNVGTNEITVKDINQNVKTYSKISDSAWHLTSITDKYGNQLVFEFNSAYQPTKVFVKPNGLSNIEMLRLLYEDGRLCAVYNNSSKDSVIFRYSGNNLASVEYCYGNPSTTEQNVRNAYLNSANLSNVTVYATATYSYDSNGYITQITDTDTSKSLSYEITGGKITKISEYAGSTLGQQVSYTYGEGYTDVRSTGNDETLNTTDDIITRHIFDSYGRSVSVYSMSVNGTEIYGATTGAYETSKKAKNSLKETTVVYDGRITYLANNSEDYFATLQGGVNKTAETGCYKQTVFEEDDLSETTYNANMKYTVSGFGYSDSITQNSNAKFSLSVNLYYYQGEGIDDIVVTNHFDFADVENTWQFTSGTIDCDIGTEESTEYNIVRKIEVVCNYYGQIDVNGSPSYAYFDKVGFTRCYGGDAYKYHYDENGNLTSKVGAESAEYYEYNEQNRITQIENDLGDCYEYVYEKDGESYVEYEYYRKLKADGEYDLVFENVYVYNKYGLLTDHIQLNAETEDASDEVLSQMEKMRTSYFYQTTAGSKIFGTLIGEMDSIGHTTNYMYDTSNGRLVGQSNNPFNTGYNYVYDEQGRLESAIPFPVAFTSGFVNYNYNSAGYLSEISTGSTSYTLFYDSFGNAAAIKAGDNTLATYEYYPKNGKLWKINYGNGFSEKYKYNNLEMLSHICYTYDDGTEELAYSYTYNADGTLSIFIDHLIGKSILYSYDSRGRLSSIREKGTNDTSYKEIYRVGYNTDNKIMGYTNYLSYTTSSNLVITRPITTSYNYNTKGYLSAENHNYLGNNHKINYTYDNFGRISSVYGNLGAFQHTEQYTYVSDDNNNTSYLVDSYTSTVGNSPTIYNYTYDNKGNITKIVIGNKEIRYVYDDLGQLVREDNGQLNDTYTYTYDNAGNITFKRTYALTAVGVSPTSPISTTSYIYDDRSWGDKLSFYNKHAITYDEIGNPLSYYNGSSYTFTWEGRKLVGAVNGSNTMSFTYNDEGIRTSKTINGVTHTYKLNDSRIISEQWEDKLLVYLYDASGSPIGMMYRQADYNNIQLDTYWFEKNLQGDIVAIYNASGVRLATYIYDAWGNHSVTYANGGASTAAQYNPFIYRGYYYDTDLGMYYLQSRYYDPNTCRFINADSVMSNVGGNILGNNLYSYCFNNPVNFSDESGNWPQWVSNVIDWVDDNVVEPIQDFIEEVKACKTSTDNPEDVLNADFVANYKDRLVIRVPGNFALSFSAILLGKGNQVDDNVLKHEYGHTVQLEKMGVIGYTTEVALPSVVAWGVAMCDELPFDYHSSPWEAGADSYGGVSRTYSTRPWNSSDGKYNYIINIFK